MDKGAFNENSLIKYAQKDYKVTILHLNKVIEDNPVHSDSYLKRGSMHLELQKYKEAICDFDKAIELNPTIFIAYFNRGISYRCIQDYKRALKDYSKSLEI